MDRIHLINLANLADVVADVGSHLKDQLLDSSCKLEAAQLQVAHYCDRKGLPLPGTDALRYPRLMPR